MFWLWSRGTSGPLLPPENAALNRLRLHWLLPLVGPGFWSCSDLSPQKNYVGSTNPQLCRLGFYWLGGFYQSLLLVIKSFLVLKLFFENVKLVLLNVYAPTNGAEDSNFRHFK